MHCYKPPNNTDSACESNTEKITTIPTRTTINAGTNPTTSSQKAKHA